MPENPGTTASHHIEPQSGLGLQLAAGQLLRVVDPQGEQVSDLIAFNAADTAEVLSSGRTVDYGSSIYLTTGDVLYSNRSNAMLTILEDDVGRHDFLLTPCSADTFKIIYGQTGYHPSCLQNLADSLGEFGISEDEIPTTFNIFMNVEVGPVGQLSILPPRSRAGDAIVFRAEMHLFIGLTACSAEMSNNYSFKPIDVEVFG